MTDRGIYGKFNHEKLVEDFLLRLKNSYGYTPDMLELNYNIAEGVPSDIAIWPSVEARQQHGVPSVCVIVVCKPEHIRIESEHYFEKYIHIKLNTKHFFVANNLKETKVFFRENNNLNSLIPIGDFPKASDLASESSLEKFILKMRKNNKDALIAAFSRCHSIIRNNDKLSPEAAFDEISKVVFIKMLYERNNPDGTLIYSREQFEKDRLQSGANNYVDELFEKVKSAYVGLFDSYDHIKISNQSFVSILQELEIVDFYDTDEDIKGIAFEAFLGKTFRGELGQFFTPRTIVDFIVNALNIREGEKVCDPCCGSGGFLIKTFDHIQKQIEKDVDCKIKEIQSDDTLSSSDKKDKIVRLLSDLDKSQSGSRMYRLCNDYLFGVDANPRMARTSKMNMIMHGDGHVGVYLHDGLTDTHSVLEGTFDVVLINPPYGVHINRKQIDNRTGISIDKLFELKGSSAEDLFVERTLKLLKPGGRAGLVLPDGLMTNKSKQGIRDYVEKHAKILNITSIPSDVFLASGANVKPSLLLIQKYKDGEEKCDCCTVSMVSDAGINSLGLPSDNLQLDELAPILSDWISKGELRQSNLVRSVRRQDMEMWNVGACFNIPEVEYNHKYPTVSLSEVLFLSNDIILIEDDNEYSRVTVKLFNKGVVVRDRVNGSNIGTRKQTRVHKGQFIISKIDGKSGAFGIIPDDLDNAIVTPDFLVFNVDRNRLNVDYLMLVLNTDSILSQYEVKSNGSTGRKRLQINTFLKTIIPLPPLSDQEDMVNSIIVLRQDKERIDKQIEIQIAEFHNKIFK